MAPRGPLLACLVAALALSAVAQDEASPFEPAQLFPTAPAPAVRNFQKLLPAATAWKDLAVFVAVVAKLSDLGALPPLPNDGSPFTVFAPTNEAFLKFLAPAPPTENTYKDTDFLFDTMTRLLAAAEDPDTPPAIIAALVGVVRYHIVAGRATEAALAAAGSVETLRAGSSLDVSAFPRVVDAENGTSTRYAHSFKVTDNGLLVPIDRVLLPIDPKPVVDFLFPSDLPAPPPAPPSLPGVPPTFQRFVTPSYKIGAAPGNTPLPPAPYSYALASYAGLLTARADLQIFTEIVTATDGLGAAVLAFNGDNHPLIPEDAAFFRLLAATGIPEYADLATRYAADRFNPLYLSEAVRVLGGVLAALPGPPSVADIVTYHVLTGGEALAPRTGGQPTLAGDAQLTIGNLGTQFFVVDGDLSRPDPRVLVTLATGSGYASVIDGVLLNINLADALATLDADALAALPRPELPEPTDQPVASTEPTRTPAPTAPLPDAAPELPGASEEPELSATAEAPVSESGATPTASDDDDDSGVCFPADARVHRADGTTVAMSELLPGDAVLTHPGSRAGSRVFLFSHRVAAARTQMVRVETASGHVVRATKGHYLFVDGRLKAFGAVRPGDRVHTTRGESRVTRVSRVVAHGLYAPHALRANLVVDGVWVSGYSTAVRPRVAEALLAPLRFVAARFGVVEPIGAALYGGADRLLRFIPRGAEAY